MTACGTSMKCFSQSIILFLQSIPLCFIACTTSVYLADVLAKLTARLAAVMQADVYTFFRQIYKMWVDCGLYPELNIEDVKDEVFDMAQPEDPLHITTQDLQVTAHTCRLSMPTSGCCTHCEYRLKHDKVEVQINCIFLLHAFNKLMMLCSLRAICVLCFVLRLLSFDLHACRSVAWQQQLLECWRTLTCFGSMTTVRR